MGQDKGKVVRVGKGKGKGKEACRSAGGGGVKANERRCVLRSRPGGRGRGMKHVGVQDEFFTACVFPLIA